MPELGKDSALGYVFYMPRRSVKLKPNTLPVTASAAPPSLPVKRNPWRPRKYETAEELLTAAEAHFELCERQEKALTLYGTVLALGFVDPAALDNYRDASPDFSKAVKYIRGVVTEGYERDLRSKWMVGSLFAMKNLAGWTDKTEVESKTLTANVDFTRLTDAQLRRIQAGENLLQILTDPGQGAGVLPPQEQRPQLALPAASSDVQQAACIAPLDQPSTIPAPLEDWHGTPRGYFSRQCRCASCGNAARKYRRERARVKRKRQAAATARKVKREAKAKAGMGQEQKSES